MKFNIIIAKRGRDKYLRRCLEYLDRANKDKKYDVCVYVISDDYLLEVSQLIYDNIYIVSELLLNQEGFNKSKLLNRGLEMMRQDYDYVSIVDLDIIYHEDFFDTVVDQVKDDIYFVSSGFKLDEKGSSMVVNGECVQWGYLSNYIDEHERDLNHKRIYPSQVSLTKNLYNRLIKILGTLYCPDFVGWGGEDSALSLLSYKLERVGLFKKIYNYGMWYHLWHTRFQEFNQDTYNENVRIMKEYVNNYSNRLGDF